MHTIHISSKDVRTDLIIEQENLDIKSEKKIEEGLKVEETTHQNHHYTTIYFDDITDSSLFQKVQKVFIKELKEYLKVSQDDHFLIIGLGNEKSTPDSLGPSTIQNILVTRYLSLFNSLEEGYSNVAVFTPNVMGNTGIETSDIIQNIIDAVGANKIIVIDALSTNHLERLGKTIQITDQGIVPGSGVGNIRKEFSKETIHKEVIAIGIPTVISLCKIQKNISHSFMVTPTNIDFLIERFSILLGEGINVSLHKNYIRQNNF